MTLGGLLKHLAHVEEDYFTVRLHGRAPGPPWDTVDWETDLGWDWRSAADDSPDELVALWTASVARARESIAEALAEGGLDQPLKGLADEDGTAPSLRCLPATAIEDMPVTRGMPTSFVNPSTGWSEKIHPSRTRSRS